MNYYEHHLGDFAKDCGYLSMIREGAYRRLIDFYYATEKPLTSNMPEVYEIARCTCKAEREAIDYVIEKFYYLGDDGFFHQKKCDEVIAAYLEGEPERIEKRVNNKERKQRSRERRRKLFEQLREQGVTPSFESTIGQLEEILSRVTVTKGHANGHAQSPVTVTPVTDSGTATHSQSPSPSPQSQNTKTPQTPQRGASGHRRSPDRIERDEARARWSALLKSGGADRDARDQAAIDAAGGWSAILQRTERDEPHLMRKFCEAYRETSA